MQAEYERDLTEEEFAEPLVLHDYPAAIKPFYTRVNDGGEMVCAMDVLVAGVDQIIGGSQREERLDVLEARMAAQGLNKADEW